MRLEYQILAAVALDLALGDPRWLPHPVRGIGWLAARLERLVRGAQSRGTVGRVFQPVLRGCRLVVQCVALLRGRVGKPVLRDEGLGDSFVKYNMRLAGLVVALAVYTIVGLTAWAAIWLAARLHPWAADAVAIALIYASIAARDLARHSTAVYRALQAGDLGEARRRVGWIVGRDTDRLDEPGVVRAAVESVAESTVDGVTAPLLFAAVAGPVGAIIYRAINTLDSMFGHQDERYREFGWASARIDDAANYLPARLTAPLVCLAAMLLGQRSRQAVVILARDGRRHASPNSGLTEAAMAGALGVQLGGRNYYDGQPSDKPVIGDAVVPLSPGHIATANALMFTTTALLLAAVLPLRLAAVQLWHLWRLTG